VQRSARGHIKSVNPRPDSTDQLESMMHFELPRLSDSKQRKAIERAVIARLERVRLVVRDHQAMRERANWLSGHLGDLSTPSSKDLFRQVTLAQKFLHWIVDENFVFLGYVELSRNKADLTVVPGTALGLNRGVEPGAEEGLFPVTGRDWLEGEDIIFLGKGDREAEVHRPGKIDHIAVRTQTDGEATVTLFTGLYTYKAINEEVHRIPILREKLATVLEEQAALPGSHLGRKLEEAFRALPVEFLFSADVAAVDRALQLVRTAEEDQEIGVHILVDSSRRAAFALISMPRNRYDEEIRQVVSARLGEVMGAGYMDNRVAFGHSGNVVLQYFLTASQSFASDSEAAVQVAIEEVTDSWSEQLGGLLAEQVENTVEAESLVERYAFPGDYVHRTIPEEAAGDVTYLETVRETGQFRVALSGGEDDDGVIRLKLYQPRNIYLTESTPVLDNFGLQVIDQNSSAIETADGGQVFLDSFRVVPRSSGRQIMEHRGRLVDALEATFRSEARDDELNALILSAGLNWHEVAVIRAYTAYARQLGAIDPIPNVHRTWNHHPEAAKILIQLFQARFEPSLGSFDSDLRTGQCAELDAAFEEYLADVDQVAEDRILRRALNHLRATLRTNFYSAASKPGHPLSLKFDCKRIDEMVSPRPYREIFVHHLAVEGVHLRGGTVARGGLRWSDRQADYRTEILGLMDTQMVKNVLIVPVGAKGGFILKGVYETFSEARTAADQLYEVFIRGLLDVTDNVIDGVVIPPENVLRYDGDDPYLVVAADKGTAHLSDTANRVASEYSFWLDDAFASGGSRGYDHKKYGITAKGAWVCTRRHFRELGMDPEKDPISVVGIGDMSGDVFGNGMLLSRSMLLLAAFNHMHIFLDPSPNSKSSWKERNRLFGLPGSTWEDYNQDLISKGGGVHPRHAKRIELTPEVQALLRTEAEALSGDQLVHAILKTEADLLWNGGIGTYVKASHETHRDAGDPANDCLRVDARDLRFRVIGEGGNLGFTQAGRVEFAKVGGRINSDAVDNSGGVDMSDHEVNLKILFTDLMHTGEVDREERDRLMLKVAEEVSRNVQSNNHDHSLMLSLDVIRSVDTLDDFRVLLNDLEQEGRLDRTRQVLPDDGEMLRRIRSGEGLSRPELSRLGPFVKMQVYEGLLSNPRFDVVDTEDWLMSYFPQRLRKRFSAAILQHQLRREIAATVLTNRLVDALGSTHFSRLSRVTGRNVVEIAYASSLAATLLDAWDLNSKIRDLPEVRASVEYVKLRHIAQSVALLAQWLLQRGVDVMQPGEVLRRFKTGFKEYERAISSILHRTERRIYQRNLRYLRNRNIRSPGSERAASLEFLIGAGEAVLLADTIEGLGVVQAGILLKRIAVESQLLRASQVATPEDAQTGWESRAIADMQSHIYQLTLIIAKRSLSDLGPLEKKTRKNRSKLLDPAVNAAWN
ncbi:MAG: NAD-glutamate dehydrogenase domain-containing protein, partial [Myxococcota bacterium]|nr:NAD-glutamate dehydrogenase domain-containing protein [Myxococcota bacterium]